MSFVIMYANEPSCVFVRFFQGSVIHIRLKPVAKFVILTSKLASDKFETRKWTLATILILPVI